jgi:hypothetical protein
VYVAALHPREEAVPAAPDLDDAVPCTVPELVHGGLARRALQRLHLGTFTGSAGLFRQTTDLTKAQIDLLAKLDIPHPKKIIELTAAPR